MTSQRKGREKVSIVFRALNEEKWFADALAACERQLASDYDVEIILVDSGSTDRTIEIAESFGARVVHIRKSDFTFGRSLNYGCEAADGDYLVFISAHCIPTHENWLSNLIAPLRSGLCDYSYGRQVGHDVSKFSERQIFEQYFPDYDKLPQEGFFANNANAAIKKSLWETYRFDEEVTGLEDMVLAKQLVKDGYAVGYVSKAPVFHIHEETLSQTKRRYYREALTLRQITPHIQISFFDFVRYSLVAIQHDLGLALKAGSFWRQFMGVISFRVMQFWGSYKGHNENRTLSRAQKESYYYPKPTGAKELKSDAHRKQHMRIVE